MSSTFVPFYCIISSISLGYPTVVTFSSENVFTVGEIVSFRVSKQYGTVELNYVSTLVISRTEYTITVLINSTWFTPFISNPDNAATLALVVPSASGVIPGAIPPQTNLEDAFDNLPET
jgi:hypothetical protein